MSENELDMVNGGLPRLPPNRQSEPQKPTPIPFNENPKIGLYFGPVTIKRG